MPLLCYRGLAFSPSLEFPYTRAQSARDRDLWSHVSKRGTSLVFFFLSQSLHFTNDLAILLEYQVAELLKPVFLPVSEKACVYVSSFVFFF